jgi:central kinetochore subunit Mis15/CHL4
MSRLSIPTKRPMPPSLRIDPSSATVQKILNRLSRPSLLSLALDWLDPTNLSLSAPYLEPRDAQADVDEPSDDFYPPARSSQELRDRYTEMQAHKGSKKEVVDRFLEGDWRHGLTLYQLAMADLQYLYDHPSSQNWSAYRILPLHTTRGDADNHSLTVDKESLVIPRFHPSTFLKNLHAEVLPDVKAHYTMDRPKDMPLLLLRIFILDSPYNTHLAFATAGSEPAAASFESSRTIFVAFPDASPYIYISKSQIVGIPEVGESRSLRSVIVEGIPKALSRPRERYTLKSTNLATRNLSALLHIRGAQRTNFAGGGWSIYADEKKINSPLDTILPTRPLSETASDDGSSALNASGQQKRKPLSSLSDEDRLLKRAKAVAQARFGDSGKPKDGRGVERVDILIEDPFPEAGLAKRLDDSEEDEDTPKERTGRKRPRRSNLDRAFEREADPPDNETGQELEWIPSLRLTFHGSHVFAGVRQLLEAGIIDGERMPGWLTGEDGVTIGAVRHGRIRGHKGSGL